jgi:quercetin 2,3-dioxygenase
MKLTLRNSQDRGNADHGWLQSQHSFSFADYYDPAHMGFRSLRVINQDIVAAGQGFPPHPHRDMEIFSYILSGALQHKDSLGNGRILQPGQIQLMSAGSGVTHSEFNPSSTDKVSFLQIWIKPRQQGLPPRYTEWHPQPSHTTESKVLVISPDGRDDSALIHQDAFIYRVRLSSSQSTTHELAPGRGAWLQLISGSLRVNDSELKAGDAVSTTDTGTLSLSATSTAEALLFDLA